MKNTARTMALALILGLLVASCDTGFGVSGSPKDTSVAQTSEETSATETAPASTEPEEAPAEEASPEEVPAEVVTFYVEVE